MACAGPRRSDVTTATIVPMVDAIQRRERACSSQATGSRTDTASPRRARALRQRSWWANARKACAGTPATRTSTNSRSVRSSARPPSAAVQEANIAEAIAVRSPQPRTASRERNRKLARRSLGDNRTTAPWLATGDNPTLVYAEWAQWGTRVVVGRARTHEAHPRTRSHSAAASRPRGLAPARRSPRCLPQTPSPPSRRTPCQRTRSCSCAP